MDRRSLLQAGGALSLLALSPLARAHHGWSSFDQNRPIYLQGTAENVVWRNPHAELVLVIDQPLQLPVDLAQRSVPAQRASVDGPGLLARAELPTRSDARWQIELAPMSRLNQWQVPEIRNGDSLAVLGFTFAREEREAILRAEYLFLGEQIYGLRSSPAAG